MNDLESIINIKNIKTLLEVIGIEEAKDFSDRGGYLSQNNVIHLILIILNKYNGSIEQAKTILERTKEEIDQLQFKFH